MKILIEINTDDFEEVKKKIELSSEGKQLYLSWYEDVSHIDEYIPYEFQLDDVLDTRKTQTGISFTIFSDFSTANVENFLKELENLLQIKNELSCYSDKTFALCELWAENYNTGGPVGEKLLLVYKTIDQKPSIVDPG